MEYFFVIIALLVVVNFYLLFRRGRKGRNVGKKATEARLAKVREHDDLVRKLNQEQAQAAKHVEMQNKMFEMFDEVRKKGEEDED